MDHTTPEAFPSTRPSVLTGMKSGEPEVRERAFGLLVEAYWKPVYGYLRLKWRLDRESAADSTQEFFLRALEKSWFDGFDPGRARFRTFLRTCIDGFVSKERRDAGRLKREGSVQLQSLDFAGAEAEIGPLAVSTDLDIDAWFHQEWVRSIFTQSVEALRRHCAREGKDKYFAVFERYDIEGTAHGAPLRYRDLAREFDIPVTQATNYLAWARREFRRLVLERLRDLTGSEEEFRLEAEDLLGVRDP